MSLPDRQLVHAHAADYPVFVDSVLEMPAALYETDILEWSRRQGAVLRQIAAGEDRPDGNPDWTNIAEEIEAVGRSELRACESLLTQALLHQLKVQAWPDSSAVPGWKAETLRFRFEAADAFAPSMRQRIDLGRLYARALRLMPEAIDDLPPRPVASACPITLDALLATDR